MRTHVHYTNTKGEDAMTCPRCGWPLGSVGCQVNCGGRRSFFPVCFSWTPQPVVVYIGRKFAKEA
jgi:hypothetical protein